MKLERDIIKDIVQANPHLRRRGFHKALKKIDDDEETLSAFYQRQPIIPDLYYFHWEVQMIQVYEVEVWHPMNDEKLAQYYRLMDILHGLEWDLALFTVDRHGNVSPYNLIEFGLSAFASQLIPETAMDEG